MESKQKFRRLAHIKKVPLIMIRRLEIQNNLIKPRFLLILYGKNIIDIPYW
jgi:hypothetical protein